VYLPGAGWVGLDPTSGLFAGEGHIPLACTPEPRSAAPITGLVDPCEVEFEFDMSVTRVVETPRVTLPYSGAQWEAIVALGHAVDADLKAGDVRLTMGGEPTFVSQEHGNREEWNTAAVGPTKRPRGDDLTRRLAERFAPGALLHHGQGKWYPGEQLPRWATSVIWRRDGVPIWRNPGLLAGESAPRNAHLGGAQGFLEKLAERLGLSSAFVAPAYEDPWYFLHREGALPPEMDPLEAELDDPMERDRLRRVFGRGLGQPAGFVLPLQRWNSRDQRRWASALWQTRHGRLMLVPGDAAMGYRLPLSSLPRIPAASYPHIIHQDPFEAIGPLPDPRAGQPMAHGELPNPHGMAQPRDLLEPQEVPGGVQVRTALTVEPRDGLLHVFLPPVETGADFVELVAALEDTAANAGTRIRIEGYMPPLHSGMQLIKVTPDPGVLEVNIHPAHDWGELVAITTGIYEDAYRARLCTEKFMLDGRHTGTGGGNHIVVGGRTPADSPFLRRPDLLGSLITYWQHHPSLSYLFSGLFIGPTSQAPRVDEARQDMLYELELALAQLPGPGQSCPPWLVDRVLRNLLVDVTGNTHRTEICIDKLYSPDSATGRLGLVE
ncbi:MAG: transglutaminase family protein, partial [Myxococcota bacterium]